MRRPAIAVLRDALRPLGVRVVGRPAGHVADRLSRW
jgi:hypothetical protein